jgi:lipid-A-disaccharide synthase
MPELRIAVVAGEPSGDVLAAGMIKAIRQRYPDAIIEGVGGQYMQAEGFSSLFDMETLSVMGLVEVLSRLPAIYRLKRELLKHFEKHPPDVYVGIDAPDFNLRVETQLKRKGIPTVHYVSPTIWAWRENRIVNIAKAADKVMGIFPFEQQVYDKHKVPFSYVGHTLADLIPISPDKARARQSLNLSAEHTFLGILPGSRRREVATLLPPFLKTFEKLLLDKPNLFALIPAANAHRHQEILQIISNTDFCPSHVKKQIIVIEGQSRDTMIASDALLLASGTVTLEAMLCKRPMVVAYKISALTYKIMERLYKQDYFSLPNILANKALVPELLQQNVNADTLSSLLLPWLNHPPTELIDTFNELHHLLRCNADEKAAETVLSMIRQERLSAC